MNFRFSANPYDTSDYFATSLTKTGYILSVWYLFLTIDLQSVHYTATHDVRNWLGSLGIAKYFFP